MSILNLFSELDQERVRQGLSPKDLCYQADISLASYYHWMTGRCDPRVSSLSRIMDVLGYDVELRRKVDEV